MERLPSPQREQVEQRLREGRRHGEGPSAPGLRGHRDALCECTADPPVVILVVVGGYEVIDLGDTSRLHDSSDSPSVAVLAAVDEERVTSRRDEERRVSLLDIDVEDPECLGWRLGCEEEDRDSR